MCKFKVCLNEVLDNFFVFKASLDDDSLCCVDVSFDAYGFGMNKICTLLNNYVDFFAVDSLSEFMKYKSVDIDKPCIILKPLNGRELDIAIKNGAKILKNYLDFEFDDRTNDFVMKNCKFFGSNERYNITISPIDLFYKTESEHKLISTIRAIKTYKKGDIFNDKKLANDITVAFVDGGYMSGLSTKLNKGGKVLVNDKEANIILVKENYTIIDITNFNYIHVCDEIIFLGKYQENTIYCCDMAKICGIIESEIYATILTKVRHIYFWRKNFFRSADLAEWRNLLENRCASYNGKI